MVITARCIVGQILHVKPPVLFNIIPNALGLKIDRKNANQCLIALRMES